MRVLSVFLFFSLVILQTCEGLLTAQIGASGYQDYLANFHLKFKYCRFVCLEKCGSTSKRSADPVEEKSIVPEGFYWRDFCGLMPSDAYALGGPSQKPQTYIGYVYDPAHNGTFVTTIFDGTPHVYNTFKGKTFKLTENIKILCTLKPDRLVWMKLTPEILDNLKDRQNVLGGMHTELSKENRMESKFHYIVKQSSKTTYAGYAIALNDTLEYAKQDGTVGTTKNFDWLMYITKEPGNETMQTKRLCSHSYEFSYKLGSIPKFYRRINWASCTYTCSEGDQTEIDKFKTNKRLKASMEYYWKPKLTFKEEEAFKAGYSDTNPKLYIGQSFPHINIFDVGYATENYAYVLYSDRGRSHIIGEGIIFNIFCTTNPDKFEWINTTSADFANLDKDRLIPGGSLSNGTKTYVGREMPTREAYPGSIHVTKDGAFLFSFYDKPLEFQVLTLKEEK